jgi:hypothetical protein
MPASTLQLFSICIQIWGSTWLAITFQLGAAAPEMSVGHRFLLASAVLYIYCRRRGIALKYKPRQQQAIKSKVEEQSHAFRQKAQDALKRLFGK